MVPRVVLVAVLAVALVGCGGTHTVSPATPTTTARHGVHRARHARPLPVRLAARALPALPAGIQDAAAAGWRGGALLVGGLTTADVSTAAISAVRSSGGAHGAGRLPQALHDAAAVALGRGVYLFGGGDGVAQHDEIQRVAPGPASGARRTSSAASPAHDGSTRSSPGVPALRLTSSRTCRCRFVTRRSQPR